MSLYAWRLVAIIASGVFVVSALIMIIAGFIKNKFYKEFHRDELVKRTRSVNSKNYLYFTANETAKYINKYVVMKTMTDKYLVCHYNRPYKKITFTIIQYSGFRKAISVLKCVELGTGDSSKIIALKRRCKYVNIIVNKVDDEELNTSAIKPISRGKIRAYCFFKFFLLLGFFIGLRHGIIELVGGDTYARAFLNGTFNIILLIASVVISALISIFHRIGLGAKSRKARNGGVLEYEFI